MHAFIAPPSPHLKGTKHHEFSVSGTWFGLEILLVLSRQCFLNSRKPHMVTHRVIAVTWPHRNVANPNLGVGRGRLYSRGQGYLRPEVWSPASPLQRKAEKEEFSSWKQRKTKWKSVLWIQREGRFPENVVLGKQPTEMTQTVEVLAERAFRSGLKAGPGHPCVTGEVDGGRPGRAEGRVNRLGYSTRRKSRPQPWLVWLSW